MECEGREKENMVTEITLYPCTLILLTVITVSSFEALRNRLSPEAMIRWLSPDRAIQQLFWILGYLQVTSFSPVSLFHIWGEETDREWWAKIFFDALKMNKILCMIPRITNHYNYYHPKTSLFSANWVVATVSSIAQVLICRMKCLLYQ